MNDTDKRNFLITGILFIAFALFTILILIVDVQPIGPGGTSVGFASFNGMVTSVFPYNEAFYKISKFSGLLSFVIVGGFGLYGLLMLIVRKSLKKVDRDILILGGFYILVLFIYIISNKIIINYRPVILDEGLEASYPSSHTMLAITVMVTAMMQFDSRVKSKRLLLSLEGAMVFLMLTVIISRFVSGVHWATDIAGSVFLSTALVMLYYSVVALFCKKKGKKGL